MFDAPAGGVVTITPAHHGSLAISYNGYEIQIDPVSDNSDHVVNYSKFPKADLILVTHEHYDHLDVEAIKTLSKERTKVICNEGSSSQLPQAEVMANGDVKDIDGITIEAVPAYNYTKGHSKFHPKGHCNGYLLTVGGLLIYVAGDTEDIPELAVLKERNIDVALLPANQPFTMTPNQLVKATAAVSPKVLIPYHLGDTDFNAIRSALSADPATSSIDLRLHEIYR